MIYERRTPRPEDGFVGPRHFTAYGREEKAHDEEHEWLPLAVYLKPGGFDGV
jgi:hypothetical protein